MNQRIATIHETSKEYLESRIFDISDENTIKKTQDTIHR